MNRKTPDERALPPKGRISRDKAWEIVLEYNGLVKYCVRKYALEITGYGRTSFVGLGPADLFDELIGAAYEGALIAAENLDPHKKNANPKAYLRRSIFRYMQREAESLLNQRGGEGSMSLDMPEFGSRGSFGPDATGTDFSHKGLDALAVQADGINTTRRLFNNRLADTSDGLVLSAEDEYFEQQAQEENEATVRAYVEQLLMANLTESERRLANVIIKGDKAERIPFFSSTFASLRDKLIKRAAWMQAEGFGVPDGWGDTIRHRIEKRAREWADAE